MSNKVGDTLELSLWFNADRDTEHSSAEAGIYKAFIHTENNYGVRLGPVSFEVLELGNERVPPPPPEFSGTPKLLVGVAEVVKLMPQVIGAELGFTEDLEQDDLDQLRKITQNAHALHNRGAVPLTNQQLDHIINEVGPETALKSLRSNADTRVVN